MKITPPVVEVDARGSPPDATPVNVTRVVLQCGVSTFALIADGTLSAYTPPPLTPLLLTRAPSPPPPSLPLRSFPATRLLEVPLTLLLLPLVLRSLLLALLLGLDDALLALYNTNQKTVSDPRVAKKLAFIKNGLHTNTHRRA
jgi:hypothetical protein